MNPGRWRVLEPLLDQALEMGVEARSRWLDDLSSGAPELPFGQTVQLVIQQREELVGSLRVSGGALEQGREIGFRVGLRRHQAPGWRIEVSGRIWSGAGAAARSSDPSMGSAPVTR
jgi:hypothetical protein